MTQQENSAELQAKAEYKLYLFLSVDLAGSTAFKFSNGLRDKQGDGESSRGWFAAIRKFYDTFHDTFLRKFEGDNHRPELWKALGDELIYRITIDNEDIAACIVKFFIEAIQQTRKTVKSFSNNLDLKGSAWVADFPARNAVIDLDSLHDKFQCQPSQESEPTKTSNGMRSQDFIGPSMDAGFRLGKAATRQKMALSVELALILAMAVVKKRIYPFIFAYDGREDFKGVLGGESYPLIWLDVEDDQMQRQTNRREAALLQRQPEVSSEVVVDFCESYIKSSYWMERPFFNSDETQFDKIPDSHVEYAKMEVKGREKEGSLYFQDDSSCDESLADVTADVLLEKMPSVPAKNVDIDQQ